MAKTGTVAWCVVGLALAAVAPAVAAGPEVGAEPMYVLDGRTDVVLGLGAVGLNVVHPFLDSGAGRAESVDDVNGLDRLFVFGFDRLQDDISTVLVGGLLVLPAVVPAMDYGNGSKWLTYGVMYSEAFLLAHGTKEILKSTVPRNRPYSLKGAVPSGEEDDYYNSFPSGHTTFAFLGSSFFSATLSREYPDAVWRVPAVVGSYALATSVGVLRISSGNHFVTDVLAGAAIGSLWGWLVPKLHENRNTGEPVLVLVPARGEGGIALGVHFSF